MDRKEFLATSYTAYHAVKNGVRMLRENGFEELHLQQAWQLQEGGKYFLTQNGTSLLAFRVGKNFVFNVAASHTDSPSLHVKGNGVLKSPAGNRLDVEKYGGLILYSLLDTPLKIAGRIVTEQNGTLVSQVVQSDYTVCIPSLSIHHNPKVNDGFAPNVQKEMLPLLGGAEDVYATLSDGEILDADLYVVSAVQPFESGVRGEYLCSPRIDNLTSVYASLSALTASEPQNVAMICCFDNEEIGSETKQGAHSALLNTVLQKIAHGLDKTQEELFAACLQGMILSVDNAHATHPAYPEKANPQGQVYLNRGIVIKHHVNYATDGVSSAVLKQLLREKGVEYQDYYNRSDLRCGSTIGLMLSADLAMNACDIGLAQLAMHSGVETVGAEDLARMDACLLAFLNAPLTLPKEA